MKKSVGQQCWRTYEEGARCLLNKIAEELGLKRVEGKQHLAGTRTVVNWEIDAKGVSKSGTGYVLIEIRRYTTSGLPDLPNICLSCSQLGI